MCAVSKPEPKPHLTATKPSTLVITALLTGIAGWVLCQNFYGDMPPLPWFGSAALLVLGVVELVTGRLVKRRIQRKPGTEPMEPLLAARLAALAKASALVGVAYFGLFLGIGIWVLSQAGELTAAAKDVPRAGLGVLAGAVLVGGALWLEWACRIPPPPDESDNKDLNPDSAQLR